MEVNKLIYKKECYGIGCSKSVYDMSVLEKYHGLRDIGGGLTH